MKRIWIALTLFIISGVLCYFEYRIVADSQQDFEQRIDDIYSLAENNENEKAVKSCDALCDEWDKRLKVTDMFLNHDIMDSISCELSSLKCYLESENGKTDFYATAEKIKKQLQSLRDSELPYAENII
ncbi:MAG: DUF4363 family protein [Acutalibacteraceae bacterium]